MSFVPLFVGLGAPSIHCLKYLFISALLSALPTFTVGITLSALFSRKNRMNLRSSEKLECSL